MEQLFSVATWRYASLPSLLFAFPFLITEPAKLLRCAVNATWCPNNRLCLHAVGALRARDLHKAHHVKGSVAHGLLGRPAMWPPDTNRASLPLSTRVLACMGDYCSSPCGRCLIVISTRIKQRPIRYLGWLSRYWILAPSYCHWSCAILPSQSETRSQSRSSDHELE